MRDPNCFAIFTTKYCFMLLDTGDLFSWFPSTLTNTAFVRRFLWTCGLSGQKANVHSSPLSTVRYFLSTSTYSASITPSSFFGSCPDEPPSPLEPVPGKPPGCAPPLG